MIAQQRPGVAARPLLLAAICLLVAAPARGEPFTWPQPEGAGTPVVLSYSFSTLLNPSFQGISEPELRTATIQAFRLWSLYAPLHFIERPDSGPPPSEQDYPPDGHPDIRIGAHEIDGPSILAHAFVPVATDVSGLAGDIHFNSNSMLEWGIQDGFPAIDFREVLIHEIGHALGLQHLEGVDAIMSSHHGFLFEPGRAPFLLPPDIAAIQAAYGAGVGSVQPIPEPSTLLLVSGVLAGFVRQAWRKHSALH